MLNKIIICVSEENITDKTFNEFKKNIAAEGILAKGRLGFITFVFAAATAYFCHKTVQLYCLG